MSSRDPLAREAAHRLADTLSPYGALTRDKLAELSGAESWRAVGFEGEALRWGVDHGLVRALGDDLYEIGPRPDLDEDRRHEEEVGGW